MNHKHTSGPSRPASKYTAAAAAGAGAAGSAQPKVSVITPTFNRPDYLKETIASVCGQGLSDWEMLIVNDGGTDVGGIVAGFRDPRLRYFNRKKNRGKAACLNFALQRAAGRYVAYIDDDDVWYPHHLETLAAELDAHPRIGAVYSDLYAVYFAKDPDSGRRYPLHKYVEVARDFNRDFMFVFNHVLHVSLMHRRELAEAVGGYDENVSVMIDWNLTRKLCFITDFRYVPVLTGEFFMPIADSDRISNRQRKDPAKYRRNLRRIKADLPPAPWTKVDRIAVVYPVRRWSEKRRAHFAALLDGLSYPVRTVLVNNGTPDKEAEIRRGLGSIADLDNITVASTGRPVADLEAYRFGANLVEADYLFLATGRAKTDLQLRLICARPYLNGESDGVKWDVEAEKNSPYDVLIAKAAFLKNTDPDRGGMTADIRMISGMVPDSMRCDYYYSMAREKYDRGDYAAALNALEEAWKLPNGGASDQYLADLYSRTCFRIGRYDEAEEKLLPLIARGYEADNWSRLGRIYQEKGRYREAIDAYRKCLKGIDLAEEDLSSPVFPIAVPVEFDSFRSLVGIGECLVELGRLTDAAAVFRKAARLKADSHRPLLGFGAIFLKTGQLQSAEEALEAAAASADGSDPEVYHRLGEVHQRRGRYERAWASYGRALDIDGSREDTVAALYDAGAVLQRWGALESRLTSLLSAAPDNDAASRCLSDVRRRRGRPAGAETAEAGGPADFIQGSVAAAGNYIAEPGRFDSRPSIGSET